MMGLLEVLIYIVILCLCKVLSKDYCNKELEECVVIKDCAPFYALVRKRTTSKADIDLLRKSHCGFLGDVPKVCCRNETKINSRNMTTPGDDVIPSTNNLLPNSGECGIQTDNKIVGGEETDLDEFPWMALITYELPNHYKGYGCGGVLISKRYVLTAAHCLMVKNFPKLWKLVSVRLGEYNKDSDEDCINYGFSTKCLKTPPINVNVEEKIVHEKYDEEDPNQRNDIALLRLNRDVDFNEYIKPICLPVLDEERKKTYSGARLTVAGWGQWGQTKNKFSSSVKRKLVVPVKSNSDCQYIYSDADKELDEKQLCAGGEKNKSSCKGDSGGALMTINVDEYGDVTWYVAGIVSFGPDPCWKEGWPAVYTRVSKYMGWIVRHMRP